MKQERNENKQSEEKTNQETHDDCQGQLPPYGIDSSSCSPKSHSGSDYATSTEFISRIPSATNKSQLSGVIYLYEYDAASDDHTAYEYT